MKELTPEAVGVAPGFSAAGQVPLGQHDRVGRTLAAGRMLVAVADVEDFESRIG